MRKKAGKHIIETVKLENAVFPQILARLSRAL
jgi:hypothetical protein